MMSSPVVDVRIRGRGETTLEAQFRREETVGEFKKRVFGTQLGEGRQCRLIAGGKELRDARLLGSYNIEPESCLHVMIGPSRTVARAVCPSPNNAGSRQRDNSTSSWATSAILLTIMVSSLIGAWTLFILYPELFTFFAASLLVLLTCTQLVLLMPLLRSPC